MNREYEATVITPFHNTDMNIFNTTVTSMLKQTIGFEKIEWIVVLHNCEEEYIKAVNELLGKYDNVRIMELYNDKSSAASPRNYGLQFISAPYVEFLDSDDSINPATIETCLNTIKKHDSDLVFFRMAYVKQNDEVRSIVSDVSLWDPLEEEIVVEGELLKGEELYSQRNSTVHNKLFKTHFIKKNNLSFDEDILMGEDMCFLVQCYGAAKKIIVLPQFIGHYYFVNSNSVMQTFEKPSKEVRRFGYGFKKIMDILLENNVYYNFLFMAANYLYLTYAFFSPDFNEDDWKTLRDEMKPYVEKIVPPQGNKVLPKEEGMQIYEFIRHNVLDSNNDSETEKKKFINGEQVLLNILNNNKNTDFGLHYGFGSITSVDEYIEAVPLYDNKEYQRLIKIQTEVGERSVITSRELKAYSFFLNETAEFSTVPVVEEICDNLGKHFREVISDQVTFLMIEAQKRGAIHNDDTYYESTLGLMVQNGIGDYTISRAHTLGELTSPMSVYFPSDEQDADYINLLYALLNENVTQIYAMNTWRVTMYIYRLLKEVDSICDDLINKKIIPKSGNMNDDGIVARVETIKKAVKSDDKRRLLKTIWPKLGRIIAENGGMFNLYTDFLKNVSDEVEIVDDGLISPFGILGYQTDKKNVYRLNKELGFFEFLCTDGTNNKRTVLSSEVQAGKIYELILTSDYGIYRMYTNYYIEIVHSDIENVYFKRTCCPVQYSKGIVCFDEDILNALENVVSDNLFEYYYFFNEETNNIEIMIELFDAGNEDTIAKAVDRELMKVDSYKIAVDNGVKPCSVMVYSKETKLLVGDIMREKYEITSDCMIPIHNYIHKSAVELMRKWKLLIDRSV